MKSKYHGSTVYVHVLGELVRAAQYRGVTTYQDIAVIMGLPIQGSHMGKETGQVLGEITAHEVQSGRPMLSAVAVNVAGKAGPGFFDLAKTLGRMKDDEDETEFWKRERESVYNAWRRPLAKD